MENSLRALRTSRGWTQRYVAKKAGITPRQLRNIEQGTSWPRLNTARCLAEVFGVTEKEIFFLNPSTEEEKTEFV